MTAPSPAPASPGPASPAPASPGPASPTPASPAPSPTPASPASRPVREVVSAGPRRPPTAGGARPAAAALYRRDEYAATLLKSLMRAQLGVTAGVLLPAAAVVALYPLLAWLIPPLAAATIGPLPLSIIVLGGGIYPPLVLLGFWYVRRSARVERRFVELLKDR